MLGSAARKAGLPPVCRADPFVEHLWKGVMRYKSDWLTLAQAVERVMSAHGIGEVDAQGDICRALSQGKIDFRAKIDEGEEWYEVDPVSWTSEHLRFWSPRW